MSEAFPRWLDPATLQWAADYCEAMAIRIGCMPVPSYVAADVCAQGLRTTFEVVSEKRRRPGMAPVPLLRLVEGEGDG